MKKTQRKERAARGPLAYPKTPKRKKYVDDGKEIKRNNPAQWLIKDNQTGMSTSEQLSALQERARRAGVPVQRASAG